MDISCFYNSSSFLTECPVSITLTWKLLNKKKRCNLPPLKKQKKKNIGMTKNEPVMKK
jgi:hypothetical protein